MLFIVSLAALCIKVSKLCKVRKQMTCNWCQFVCFSMLNLLADYLQSDKINNN